MEPTNKSHERGCPIQKAKEGPVLVKLLVNTTCCFNDFQTYLYREKYNPSTVHTRVIARLQPNPPSHSKPELTFRQNQPLDERMDLKSEALPATVITHTSLLQEMRVLALVTL